MFDITELAQRNLQCALAEQHGQLPFPEGTACAEVLKAGATPEQVTTGGVHVGDHDLFEHVAPGGDGHDGRSDTSGTDDEQSHAPRR